MSKYRRDDKTFRTQIATLADAGLKFPTAPAKLPEYPLHFDEMETTRGMSEATDYTPLEIAPKGKLPEFVAGAIAATIVLLLVAGAAYLGWRIL